MVKEVKLINERGRENEKKDGDNDKYVGRHQKQITILTIEIVKSSRLGDEKKEKTTGKDNKGANDKQYYSKRSFISSIIFRYVNVY